MLLQLDSSNTENKEQQRLVNTTGNESTCSVMIKNTLKKKECKQVLASLPSALGNPQMC